MIVGHARRPMSIRPHAVQAPPRRLAHRPPTTELSSMFHRLLRRRVVSGLLGLLAMSLSLAEAGAASMCGPSMQVHHDAEVVAPSQADAMLADMALHGSHPEAPQVAEDQDDPPPCPWMPVVGAGCTAPVPVPTVEAGFDPVATHSGAAFRTLRDLASLHSTDPLLPPPRA